jgi:hypothetical protein
MAVVVLSITSIEKALHAISPQFCAMSYEDADCKANDPLEKPNVVDRCSFFNFLASSSG